MVPLLLLFLDIKIVIPTASILALTGGAFLFSTFQTRKWVRKDMLLLLIPPHMVGIAFSTYVLVSIKSSLLKTLLGLFIMGYALKILFRGAGSEGDKEFKNYVGIIAAFLSGITRGLFAAGGG